ncbi:MAG TPA: MlaD family protein [Candidatus Acidoferrum sp.]|nr:MlaD family protein [Candidatus Acidoferrum sp.]
MSRAFRVGFFVVLALLFLSAGVFLVGNKEFLFSSTYRLKTDFPNAAGLNNGAEVRVGGVHEGTVNRIDLPVQPGGKVTVVMKLHSSTRNIIRKDSIAAIKTEGLLGNKFVEISFGSEKAQAVMNDDVIASESPLDMTDQAKSLAANAQAGVKAFRDDMEALQQNFLLRGFFNKRGYNDSSELTKHAISKVPQGPPIKEFNYDATQIFDKPDNAQLKDKKALDEAGRFLAENKFDLAVVVSSAVTGDTEKDLVLTKARAKVIRDYLAQNFKLDDTRIRTIGLGKSKKEGDTVKVQILVYASKPAAP